ncbi:MAG: hypothetical protein WA459_18005 [Stellaceae bacterium]
MIQFDAISVTTEAFQLNGGSYQITCTGYGDGTVTLQKWAASKLFEDAALPFRADGSAAQRSAVELAAGTYRFALVDATKVNINLAVNPPATAAGPPADRMRDTGFMPHWLARHGFVENVVTPLAGIAAGWSGTLTPAAARELLERDQPSLLAMPLGPDYTMPFPGLKLTLSPGGHIIVGAVALAAVVARNVTIDADITLEN